MTFLGKSPASPQPSWGAYSNGCPMGNLNPRITYKVLQTLVPYTSSQWLESTAL